MNLPRPFLTDKANHRFYGSLAAVISALSIWLIFNIWWTTAIAALLGAFVVGLCRELLNKYYPVDGKPPNFDPEDLKYTTQPGLILSLLIIILNFIL